MLKYPGGELQSVHDEQGIKLKLLMAKHAGKFSLTKGACYSSYYKVYAVITAHWIDSE